MRDLPDVPTLLFVPTPDRSALTEVFVSLLPSTLPMDDLTRAVGRLELTID
jgi:hypothetical protein